ncbi:sensor histidine kinase [Saccharopolyspora hordei]|uniref:histidine kinase n=1 Tax=Saccharopolyspora hordei TaxID=1838 RepID=A0A853AFC4_9PSEU|nr:histidine kinase [Saccharopolyspora hordei]NYI83242.1 signal transduction histidine kinase [Saccharopolyspora hordei]
MWMTTARRGAAVALLSLAGPLLFVAYALGLCVSTLGSPWLGERVVGWCRAAVDRARRLAGEWCEVPIASPYRPAPPAPQPDAEGWYRYEKTLYRTPRVPRYLLRVHWLAEDPATGRDMSWLLLGTVVGPLLGLLAVLGGQPVLRAYGRWTRTRLAPAEPRPWQLWVNRGLRDLWRLAVLALLAVVHTACGVVLVVLFVLTHVLGAFLWWPWCAALAQRLAGLGRRLAGTWSGTPVDELYRPLVEPVPTADGFYRVGRELRRSPRPALRRARYRRAMTDPATGRDVLWLLGDGPVTALLLAPVVALCWGFAWGLWIPFWVWVGRFFADYPSPWEHVWAPAKWLADTPLLGGPLGLLCGAAVLALAPVLLRLHGRWTRALLAPTEKARLAARVQRLAETRADAVDAEDAELRRIERDLHDGVQARLVALGLKLSAAEQLVEREPERARELLGETKADSGAALAELRSLVRGIRPPVLTERGLVDAVRAVALDLVVPVEVEADVPGRCPSAIEAAAYFATLELITNAVKHGRAESVRVQLRHADHVLRVVVTDDGVGGADPELGGGLRGIRRRIGTFDGTLELTSPRGGPTAAMMEIPCELS